MLELEHTRAERLDLEAELAKARLLARVLGDSSRALFVLGHFDVLRCIGRGGMGKVFEARDRDTGARLALKTLHDARGDALAQIKREFRALATLSHPNLAAMYELHQVAGLPFFTMELVDGQSVSEYLQAANPVDDALIRSCLLQLVEVLGAIHGSGTVHGDIKPSNLLLRRDGRLILVDFGVARALGESRLGPASGTSKYMAPERAAGARADAASDWYAVGALLEALLAAASGQERQRFASLSAGLLERDPSARFGAREIQRALGAPSHSAVVAANLELFVAREAELAALHAAFEAAQSGPSLCMVTGDPGLGKTALVEHFLSTPALAEAVVLRGRCYEHEALPYKGFDGVIEALRACPGLSLPDSVELGQVFPMLTQPPAAPSLSDPRVVRRKAFAALAALLSALTKQRRVVLFLDDLQWGDADGAALLEQLLLGAERPALLWIATCRAGESGPAVAALTACAHATLSLQPLAASACAVLARGLAPEPLDPSASAQVVHESGGSPRLLRALLRSGPHASMQARTYGALMVATLDRLEPAARELLELTVLAGRPVRPALLREAAGAAEHPWQHLAALHNAGLLRTLARAGQPSLSPHHDRVAEAVASLISPEQRCARHLALARAAEALKLDDPELLADQLFRADARAEAALHFERAGDRARDAAALQRACEHYARALECCSPERPVQCLRRLADACAAIGDLARAAPLYLEAAARASDPGQLQLKAAEMYLLSGADRAGMELLRPALRQAGIWLPASTFGALALGLVSLVRVQWALHARAAPAQSVDQRAEIAFRIGYCIALMHPHEGAALLLWSGARALRLGSPAQRGCALVHTAYVHALLGLGSRAAQDARIAQALLLTQDDRIAHAFVLCGDAVVSFARAECVETLHKCASAHAFIEAEHVEERWLLTQLQTIVASVRVLSGDFQGLHTFASQLAAEASELGNHAVVVQAHSARAWAGLAAGDTTLMQAYARDARASWKAARLSTLYGLAIWGECHRLLYEGQPRAALTLMREEAPRFARSSLARTQPWSVAIALLWACLELTCSARPRDAHWRAAETWRRRLAREKSQWAAPCVALLAGAFARRLGETARARALYEAARDGFERNGMHGYAAAAGYRVAELLSAPSNALDTLPWFRAQGVAEPAKWVRMYSP